MHHKFFDPAIFLPMPGNSVLEQLAPAPQIEKPPRTDPLAKLNAFLGPFIGKYQMSDLKFMTWCALALRASYSPDKTFMRRAIDDIGTFTITYQPNDATTVPGYTTAVSPDGGMLLISGTTNKAQANALMEQSDTYLEEPGPFHVNKVFHDNALPIATTALPRFNLAKPLYIIGHSYGGAIGATIAAAALNSGVAFGLIGFGAPKPGFQDMQDHLQTTAVKSFVAADDPVPSLPPTPWSLLTFALFPGSLATHWEKTRPITAQALFVSDTDQPVSGTAPNSPNQAIITVAQQLLGADPSNGVFGSGHNIATYYNRLRQTFATWEGGPQITWPGRRDLDALAADLTAADL